MCGIAAWLARGQTPAPTAMQAALQAMAGRGPDGRGMHQADTAAIAHLRLAIVDVDGPDQPMHSEDGRITAAVHGEFYGFEVQRRQLEARGHRFRSRGDSEILVHLYEDYGLDCVHYLRGEFAFVLWDGHRKQLVAARDRFGVKPLHWAEHAGTLWLATEAKALLAAGVPAAWSEQAWRHVLHHQYLPPDQSLFHHVHLLPPGCLLIASVENIRTQRYHDLDLPQQDERTRRVSSDEARALGEELIAALEDAVAVRLNADVPMATSLSGGLDSALIAALAARGGAALPAFHLGFAGEAWDECAAARRAALHVGAELTVVPNDAAAAVTLLGRAAWQAETLAINGQLSAKWRLAQAIRASGAKVVLSGEGADELLFGYAHLALDSHRHDGHGGFATGGGTLANAAQHGVMLPADGIVPPLAPLEAVLGWTPTFLATKHAMLAPLRALFDHELTDARAADSTFINLFKTLDVSGQLRGRHPVDQAAYLWTRLALAGYILRGLGDGTEMAHGVEGRLPFLDDRVAGVARRIPLSLLLNADGGKDLLREVARPWLPDAVRLRPKQPLLAPPIGLVPDAKVDELVQAGLRGPGLDAVPGLRRSAVVALAERWPRMCGSERAALDPTVHILLCAAAVGEHLHSAGSQPCWEA